MSEHVWKKGNDLFEEWYEKKRQDAKRLRDFLDSAYMDNQDKKDL